jgi:predicted membrane-bound spermidine synthase
LPFLFILVKYLMKQNRPPAGPAVKCRLYAAAAVSGLCIMLLELTGSRMIAPFLGASIVVWTAVIGVIMASMAAGYYAGGRIADARPSTRFLAAFIAGAALWIALLAFTERNVLLRLLSSGGNIYVLSVIASLLFFAVSGFLLAAVTPFVIRLLTAGKTDIGAIAGKVSAFSTAGGIAGTFLGGFVLVSYFSVTTILLLTAFALAVASLVTFSANIKTAALLCIAAIGAFAGVYRLQKNLPNAKALETAYNSLFVADYVQEGRKMRALYTDSEKLQGRMYVDAPDEMAADYLRFTAEAFLSAETKTLLMLGGGVYVLPRWIASARPDIAVDIVEIDPGITRAARDFFHLHDRPGQRIFHEDARYYVNRLSQQGTAQYDLVFQDTYGSPLNVPFQLATAEYFKRVRALLTDGGVFALNFIGNLDSAMLSGLYAALGEAFPVVLVFPVNDGSDTTTLQNIVLAAYKSESVPDRGFPAAEYTGKLARNIPAFTDNFAPVERYTLEMVR